MTWLIVAWVGFALLVAVTGGMGASEQHTRNVFGHELGWLVIACGVLAILLLVRHITRSR